MERICHRHRSSAEFADTDAGGWVHFSKILVYAERTEHEFLKKSGIFVIDREKGGWPRVKVTCEYQVPLFYGDEFEVCLSLARIGNSSLHWKFQVLKDGTIPAAHGEMITVKVAPTGKATALSDEERSILEKAL